ncbi:MAG: ammonia-forming cytochrome c nitrite reductase subunit c552 [Coriobacteriales bacterium]|jgi:nitrite reductase (cytochrome c-552)|nr:ammonia-forming cytochrome c nitrite reductase subunit c552 [Coriobacteriales bacterium]
MQKRRLFIGLGILVLCILMLTVVACSNGPNSRPGGSGSNVTIPDPNENGIVTAKQWAEIHPDIYASYMENLKNDQMPSYLLQFPYLVTLYDGMGFAKDYNEARSHLYTLQDVAETARPHALANCLSCKSPELTVMVNTSGDSIYATDFAEIYGKISEPVSCYSCHANTNGDIVLSSKFLINALGADASKVNSNILACGQCHNEYYFDPDSKAVTLPWNGIDKMRPDDILAYYNSIKFVDFTNSISNTGMIKIQHPEMETVLGQGNKMQIMGGLTCSDCHMGIATNTAGDSYISHNWQSPLENQALIDSKCSQCHNNLAKTVGDIQSEITARETVVGQKIASLHQAIGKAAADGSKTDTELAELRSLLRDSQFYWDFCFVENSEGAHNSAFARNLLDKAEGLVDQALAKF